MKKIVTTGELNAGHALPKRTPRDAEAELTHLETALSAIFRMPRAFPLGPSYWRARLRGLDGQYALLASQKTRLVVLGQRLDAFEGMQAAAMPQAAQRRIAA